MATAYSYNGQQHEENQMKCTHLFWFALFICVHYVQGSITYNKRKATGYEH